MNAKEEGIIRALKEISKMESEVAKKAVANNHIDVATHTMIVAKSRQKPPKSSKNRGGTYAFQNSTSHRTGFI